MSECKICGNEILPYKAKKEIYSSTLVRHSVNDDVLFFVESNLCKQHCSEFSKHFACNCSGDRSPKYDNGPYERYPSITTDTMTMNSVNEFLTNKIHKLSNYYERNGFIDTCEALVFSGYVSGEIRQCSRHSQQYVDGHHLCNMHATRLKKGKKCFLTMEIIESVRQAKF